MIFIKLGIIPVLLFIGFSSALLDPRTNGTHSLTGSKTLLPLPTSGQSFPTQTVGLNTSYALGGPPIATATQTSIPLDWSSIVTSNFSGPRPLNVGANITFINSTVINGTFPNIPPPGPQNVHFQKRAIPAVTNWRNQWGLNWVTTIQDQGRCESCWAFAATALMETMVRIQHGMWSKRSEADLHDSMGVACGTGGGADGALAWAAGQGAGIADEACDPYHDRDDNYLPCADRSGRALRVPAYTTLSNVDDEKRWIVEVGPITATFQVFDDFYSWVPARGPYKYDGTSTFRGTHVILIVGYDDNQGCWIIRNSWGTGWGDSGYGLISYGQANIDAWYKFGITNVSPDPWTRKRHHNGNMYQSGNGATHRNFELVRAGNPTGFTHVWRGDQSPFTWTVATHQLAHNFDGSLIPGQYVVGQPVITGTSFNRDFEVLYWEVGGYLRHWYYSQAAHAWFHTGKYGYGQIAGYPGFTQTTDSNFAVVVRNTDGSLYEWERSSSSGDFTYQRLVATDILQSGPSLIQSNIGMNPGDPNSTGNLYVVAVLASGRMQMFWRASDDSDSDAGTNTTWTPSEVFGYNIPDTPPVMVQDYWRTENENTPGGFQLCVAVDGQVQHWQRINTDIQTDPPRADTQGDWELVFTFGSDIRHVWSLVHGSFNQALELVVEDYQGNLWEWEYTGTWAPTALIPGP